MFVDGAWTRPLSGETFTAESPATGETIGEVPQGDRDDAQRRDRRGEPRRRRLGAADRVRARGRACTASPTRSSSAATSSRTTLTLDQGKPLAEARDEVEELVAVLAERRRGRQAARGAARRTRVTPGQARAARPPPARRDRRDHAVELAVHDARRADRARARVRQHRRLDARVDDGVARDRARRVRRRGRPAAGRLQPRHRARARSSATRSRATPARTASASSARPRPAARSRRRRPARRRCSSSAATARSSCWTTPTSTLAAEATVTACFLCAGQSCTAGERLLVHRDVREEFVAQLARARHGARRARRPVRRADDDGPAEQRRRRARRWTSTSPTRSSAARELVRGGARADGFPTRALLAGDRARRRPGRLARRDRGDVRPGRARRRDRLARRRRSSSTNASPYGLLSAIFTRDLAQGLRFADAVTHRLGEHQRVVELLGERTCRSAAGPARRAASAASAARRRWSRSPSCRRSSSRDGSGGAERAHGR